jgi:hypothetical protein
MKYIKLAQKTQESKISAFQLLRGFTGSLPQTYHCRAVHHREISRQAIGQFAAGKFIAEKMQK